MSIDSDPAVAFFLDADAYVETRGKAATGSGPAGLMGRQVAGKEFLDAYLTHGRASTLTAVVRTPDRADPLRQIVRSHPSGKDRSWDVRVVAEPEFLLAAAGPAPAARVL